MQAIEYLRRALAIDPGPATLELGLRAGKIFGQTPFDELFMLGMERDEPCKSPGWWPLMPVQPRTQGRLMVSDPFLDRRDG